MKERNKSKKKVKKSDLEQALIRKALGYDTQEVVEEYVGDDDGEIKLTKKKVTIKNVAPDMTALKLLLEEQQKQVADMTDEELQEEKIRLLKLLNEFEKDKGENI